MRIEFLFSLVISILLVAPLSSGSRAQESKSKPDEQRQYPPPPPPPPVPGTIPFPVLGCANHLTATDHLPRFTKEYAEYLVFNISERCWTVWLIRPEKAKTFDVYTESNGLILVEKFVGKEPERRIREVMPKQTIRFHDDLDRLSFNTTSSSVIVIITMYETK